MSLVKVQLFASYADLIGTSSIEVPLHAGDRVADLLRTLRSLPAAAMLPPSPRIAVNRAFAGENTLLQSGDEIALIPPVAGG